MSIQKYPVGLQDFNEVISRGCVYVDKTFLIYKLLNTHKYYFLSRPRRFGKSLLISTLDYLLNGKKDLFKDLYIYDKWEFQEYPIIRISFSRLPYENYNLVNAIKNELSRIAESYQIELSNEYRLKDMFERLIFALFQKYNQQVVILIDEYDKPLIDYLDKDRLAEAKENRAILKSFYSILKDADPYLKMVFITGVSKFSQISIFSDLNNLHDISLKDEYNELCGISQLELEKYFHQELNMYNKSEIKKWYNGYKWNIRGETVYNPFSILNFFSGSGDFHNFWYSTGTPTFLMNLCKENRLYELNEVTLSQTGLNSFDLENLNIVPILFQTGYLTIKSYNDLLKIYHLDFPNNEVKSSFTEGLLEIYSSSSEPIASDILNKLFKAITQHTKHDLEDAINLAFEHIPYDLWIKDNEKFYHIIVHLIFTLLGVNIESEIHTKNGRADIIIHFNENVFCLEFKLNQSAEEAFAQIENRGYLQKYQDSSKILHKIGINFNSKTKMVDGIVWESTNK
jgi:hypothetical protein